MLFCIFVNNRNQAIWNDLRRRFCLVNRPRQELKGRIMRAFAIRVRGLIGTRRETAFPGQILLGHDYRQGSTRPRKKEAKLKFGWCDHQKMAL